MTIANDDLCTQPAMEFVKNTVQECGVTLDVTQQMGISPACFGRVVVGQSQLDLFAAQLAAAVSAGQAQQWLYDNFVKNFGGNAGRYVG